MPDAMCHRLPFQKYVIESKDFESFGAQPLVAAPIVRLLPLLVVLPAIELNDDAAVETDEIDDVLAQWHLPPKLESRKAAASQLGPDKRFGLSLVVAQLLGAVAMSGH